QALARLEQSQGRSREALAFLDRGLKELPEQVELLWESADLLVAAGSGKAREAVDRLKSRGVEQPVLDVFLGRLLIQERKWAEALDLLVNAHSQLIVREGLGQSPVMAGLVEQCNVLLTQGYEHLGDYQRAQLAYQRILDRNPRSQVGHFGVARAYAMT